MNYFERFSLPVAVDIDLAQLKQAFLTLQRQYHPDNNPEQRDRALIESSEINHAYQVLSQVDRRAAYLLQLVQQDQGLDQSIHDFEFLQSALETREQLDDATSDSQLHQLKDEVNQWIDGLVRQFKLDYHEKDWAEARDTVRKLTFFCHVLADIAKAEDALFEEDEFLDDF